MNRWVGAVAPPLLALLVGAGLAGETAAQAVTGRVLAEGSGAEVAGALVQLLGAGEAAGPRALTRQDGSFSLLAPAPGTYRLQVDRIGFERHLSGPVELIAGAGREIILRVAARPISLEGITAQGQARECSIRSDGELVSRVWEEARKALQTVSLTQSEQLVTFDIQGFRRERDPRTHQLLVEQRRARYNLAENPFRSVSPEELGRLGYIRASADSVVYYGPDAEVLLSDAFLDGHCFRISAEPGEEGLIGLEFSPAGRLSQPDIEGVMWLDRRSSELRAVDYRYVGHGLDIPDDVAGGRIEFSSVPSGAWVVNRWSIRMPVLVLERQQTIGVGGARVERRNTVVKALIEEGGELVAVHAASRGEEEVPTGSVTGFVVDSIAGGLLPGAVVRVTGTAHQTVTDTNGHFRLSGVPAGRHLLSFEHPVLAALGTEAPEREVIILEGEEAVAALAVPSPAGIVRRYCPAQAGAGMLVGFLRELGTGEPVAGARVTVSWGGRARDGAVISLPGGETRVQRAQRGGEVRELGVATDASGLYRICGIPLRTDITLQAVAGAESIQRPLRVGGVPVVAEDMVILPE